MRAQTMLWVAGLVGVAVAGCTSQSATPADEGQNAPVQLNTDRQATETAVSSPRDPKADIDVDDQSGDGGEVTIESVTTSIPKGFVVITDENGRILGVSEVTPGIQPVTIRLDNPVPSTQELVASLRQDDGDGRLDVETDELVFDDENEVVLEDFDYLVRN